MYVLLSSRELFNFRHHIYMINNDNQDDDDDGNDGGGVGDELVCNIF